MPPLSPTPTPPKKKRSLAGMPGGVYIIIKITINIHNKSSIKFNLLLLVTLIIITFSSTYEC
jgi:hypothetical protein